MAKLKIGPTLADAKALYIRQVKERATHARAEVFTPGKDAVYAEKQRQAREGKGRYIEAEAKRNGITEKEAAARILAIADSVADALATIDDWEQDAVVKIKLAQSISEAYSHSIAR